MRHTVSPLALRPSVLLATAAALLLTACANAPKSSLTTLDTATTGITGIVHGGQQVVSGSNIQLWAVGTTGNGSAATPLLSSPVISDSAGNFNISGLYRCPAADTLLYITGTGGNPGLSRNNPQLAMMTALGPCGNLNSGTFVVMNEITTVGSIFALNNFMTGLNAIGYGTDPSDLTGITAAFARVNEFVDTTTGVAGGRAIPTGFGVSIPQINALADILATCVNSTGGVIGDGSPCGNLFELAGGVANNNVVTAALQIANSPSTNATQLFDLIEPASPFQPILTASPNNWTISVLPKVATPVISPAGGTFTSAQTVTITDTTPGAVIHYTIDGTVPTEKSPVYTNSLTVSTSQLVNAIGIVPGDLDSADNFTVFTIK